ncbi:hypothetical protein [Candidatus Carsonella ruddii]|uniref:4Fe-4S ferredoxin-type domain-containing protein n=1 Tax=Carsonella ruddii TaxID=114186 RepID=A0AAE7G465_CARRU|nr:hypothetical protein [Candidatus Carsonella ruddii]AGS06615.1 hypothetical protein CRDC_00655 [Candidatus Carsonella ruddii DC]ALA96859.1 hypothetical protein AMC76_00685 [Candidatus Carsonella ruddii]QLK14090.1 hypothetical protein FK493_00680 [Candidatus Carsonella ruddii]
MKYKHYILYNIKKTVKNCINCSFCIYYCPKYKINIKKKNIFIKYCNFCNYCNIFCKINCIK